MDSLEDAFPIIAHESTGADCCGCIVLKVTGKDAELRCNECGAVVGVVQVDILRDLISMIPDAAPKRPVSGRRPFIHRRTSAPRIT